MGGLGNQLYQYAMSEKLKSLGKEAKLDFFAYKEAAQEEHEWRELELEWLEGLHYEVCTSEERILFLDNSMRFADRLRRKITGRRDRTVKENAAYMPEIFAMDEVYLYGFWDCERYYTDMLPLLQQQIRFPQSKGLNHQKNVETAAVMAQENSVSIHIRRQDYLTVAGGQRYMGICTEAYYNSAIAYICERIENPVFYIFSDDVEYAKALFGKPNMHVVDWNNGKDSMFDMELMSCCRHNICANSTFSMWGARLNKNLDKLVIRPLHHDNYETLAASQVQAYWPGWILIDADGKVQDGDFVTKCLP